MRHRRSGLPEVETRRSRAAATAFPDRRTTRESRRPSAEHDRPRRPAPSCPPADGAPSGACGNPPVNRPRTDRCSLTLSTRLASPESRPSHGRTSAGVARTAITAAAAASAPAVARRVTSGVPSAATARSGLSADSSSTVRATPATSAMHRGHEARWASTRARSDRLSPRSTYADRTSGCRATVRINHLVWIDGRVPKTSQPLRGAGARGRWSDAR